MSSDPSSWDPFLDWFVMPLCDQGHLAVTTPCLSLLLLPHAEDEAAQGDSQKCFQGLERLEELTIPNSAPAQPTAGTGATEVPFPCLPCLTLDGCQGISVPCPVPVVRGPWLWGTARGGRSSSLSIGTAPGPGPWQRLDAPLKQIMPKCK